MSQHVLEGSRKRRSAPRLKRSANRSRAIPPLVGLTPIAIALLVWSLVGSDDSLSYPPPTTWWESLKELNSEGLVIPAITSTFKTFGLAMVIVIVFGVAIGYVIGSFTTLDLALSPVIDFFRSLPPPAVVSVVLLIVGIGYSSALLMVALGAVWPVVLNTAAGVRALPPLRSEVSRMLGLSRFERLLKAELPSLLPSILLGIKIAVSVAFVVTIFVEILNVTEGLGSLLTARQKRFDGSGTWALLFLIGVCGFMLNVLVALAERVLLRGRQVGNA